MPGEDAFNVEGVIIEVLPNQTCWVELANGHRLRGFVAGWARKRQARLAAGQKVRLQLSPCDLSEGRILSDKEINL
jgi:translation initiation factor IF-1